MTLDDLMRILAAEVPLTETAARRATRAPLERTMACLARGEAQEVDGIGSFKVEHVGGAER